MFQNLAGAALLANDALNLFGEGLSEDHLTQPYLRVGIRQKTGQVSVEVGDRCWGYCGAATLRVIDHVAQFIGNPAVAQTCFVCGDLYCGREKTIIIGIKM